MDPQTQFCPNLACCDRGRRGQGNISIHSQKEQRYKCTTCTRTFAATQGTMHYRLRTPAEVVTQVLTLLAHGCPPQAIVAAFGLDERTVAAWQQRAGQHCQQVHEHLVQAGQVELGHVQADELYLKTCRPQTTGGGPFAAAGQGDAAAAAASAGRVWQAMAMAVPSRLWLGGVISAHRDTRLIRQVAEQIRACACSLVVLVCVDGLGSYVTAIGQVFRVPVLTGTVGRPRLVRPEGVRLAQVLKMYAQRRVAGATRRVVFGHPDDVERAAGIPLLHIADPLGEAIKADGLNKVGLLGSCFTMEDDRIVKGRLASAYGIETVVPNKRDAADVDRIILNELVRGFQVGAVRMAPNPGLIPERSRGDAIGIDIANRGSRFAFDLHRTAVNDALGHITVSAYDSVGNVAAVTDARGSNTQFVYGALNRRTKTIFSDGTSTTVVYDALGRKFQEFDQCILGRRGDSLLGLVFGVQYPQTVVAGDLVGEDAPGVLETPGLAGRAPDIHPFFNIQLIEAQPGYTRLGRLLADGLDERVDRRQVGQVVRVLDEVIERDQCVRFAAAVGQLELADGLVVLVGEAQSHVAHQVRHGKGVGAVHRPADDGHAHAARGVGDAPEQGQGIVVHPHAQLVRQRLESPAD